MINSLHIFIKEEIRHVIGLPRCTPLEYNQKEHSGYVFQFNNPDLPVENFIGIWKTSTAENEEERKCLIELDKIGFLTDK